MKLYFGKIGKREQLEGAYYAGGPEGNSWYGGIKAGDYIFPIAGSIDRLWKVKEYTRMPNPVNPNDDHVATFEVIKTFEDRVPIAHFIRYMHFELNIDLLNKVQKPIKNCSFFEVATTPDCPNPEVITFNQSNLRNVNIAIEQNRLPQHVKNDIVVLLDSAFSAKITSIKMFNGTELETYSPLWNLYLEKNLDNQRYSLHELLEYANQDGAPKKKAFITAVLDSLTTQSYFRVENPILLYDNILVGRKRSGARSSEGEAEVNITSEDSNEEIIDNEYDSYAKLMESNPNIIFYGPPGTGKTYAAERLVEAFERRRFKNKAMSYDELLKEGRVQFVSFHQSYSYEEFVEGIRPIIDESASGSNTRYQIQPGILLKAAEDASRGALQEEFLDRPDQAKISGDVVWKIALGARIIDENIYNACKENNYIAIGWLKNINLIGYDYEHIFSALSLDRGPNDAEPKNDASSIDAFLNGMKKGDIVFIYDSPTCIRDIGVISDDEYQYVPNDALNPYPHRRSVQWLKEFDKPFDIMKYNGDTRMTMKTVYRLNRINIADVRNILSIDRKDIRDKKKTLPPYYLIIDEINRGNIAKVFGELISLIENDKRDKMVCKLLYSKKSFTLPSNLYFIGTMNTADRSIAILGHRTAAQIHVY